MLRRSADSVVRRQLAIPFSRAFETGFTSGLKNHTKLNELRVIQKTVCKLEVGRPRNRYRKWVTTEKRYVRTDY